MNLRTTMAEDDQLDEVQLAKLEALRAAFIAGEESGPSTEFDFDAFLLKCATSILFSA
nr:type II toxin-antitoxin system ParD family antitoxin [Asticcacaulis benevestitus]